MYRRSTDPLRPRPRAGALAQPVGQGRGSIGLRTSIPPHCGSTAEVRENDCHVGIPFFGKAVLTRDPGERGPWSVWAHYSNVPRKSGHVDVGCSLEQNVDLSTGH